MPKLIADDIPLLQNLLQGVFPGSTIPEIQEKILKDMISKVCLRRSFSPDAKFVEKVLQLFSI